MAMDTSGFVPKGNLNADADALNKKGRGDTVKRIWKYLKYYRMRIILSLMLAAISVILITFFFLKMYTSILTIFSISKH